MWIERINYFLLHIISALYSYRRAEGQKVTIIFGIFLQFTKILQAARIQGLMSICQFGSQTVCAYQNPHFYANFGLSTP
jgi:hypothetical protein